MRTVAFWAVPPLLALALYWPGLTCWFQKDDFAWLCLRNMVHTWHDVWWALFAPLAQGTIRTLSERVFFMSFYSLFGLHALPYRCFVFLTSAVTVTLLSSVCTKLTNSRAAGFWAAVLWTVNNTTAFVLSWTSIYYELLCACVLLLSFWFLLRYIDTGEKRFYIAQCVTFVLGFGVLELNVVYPALALAYALCCARRVIGKILPLFILSAAYTWIHMAAAPLQASGPYQMFWDARVFSTLWTYWKIALGPNRLIYLGIYPSAFRSFLTIALMAGLIGFLLWKVCHREWLAAFFAAWFIIVLAPLLPLRNHMDDSYLTVPLIGQAMLGGWAVVSAWRSGLAGRLATIVLLVVYICVSVPVARVNAVSFADRSHRIERLLLGIVSVSRSEPGKVLLLKGVDFDMFWSAISHRPFRLFGINEIYLVPEDEQKIGADPKRAEIQEFFLSPVNTRDALNQHRAVVLDVSGGRVRNITNEYHPWGLPSPASAYK